MKVQKRLTLGLAKLSKTQSSPIREGDLVVIAVTLLPQLNIEQPYQPGLPYLFLSYLIDLGNRLKI